VLVSKPLGLGNVLVATMAHVACRDRCVPGWFGIAAPSMMSSLTATIDIPVFSNRKWIIRFRTTPELPSRTVSDLQGRHHKFLLL